MTSPLRILALTAEERKRAQSVGELAAKGEAALGELIAQLDDPSWAVRRAVIAALAALGEPAIRGLAVLLEEQRGNEGRLAAAVDALVAANGDVESAALVLAESSNPAVVCDAAQILGRRRSSAGVAKLAALTKAADDNVALAAIEALGRIGDDGALTPLIEAVEGRSFFRTFPAIDVLGRTGSARAVKPLLAVLSEPHYVVEAARALGRIGDPAAVATLAGLLLKPSDAIARAGAIAIAEILERQAERFGATNVLAAPFSGDEPQRATQRILQCLNVADPGEQEALVRVVCWIGGESAAVALLDLVSADHAAAQAALAALARLGRAVEPQLLHALVQADSERRLLLLPLLSHRSEVAVSVAACLSDPNPSVRVLACDALARIGDPAFVGRLFELLRDPDPRVVQSAGSALQSLGSADTERLALEAARSSDARVRRAALRIIAYFGYKSATDLLIEAMGDPDERISYTAIFGLPFLDDPRGVEALLGATTHPSPRMRAASMRALGQAPAHGRTIGALRTGLHDPDAWVRYFACQALSRLRDEESADLIAALVADPAGQVRVAVVEALAQLRGARALDALHRAAVSHDSDVQRAALLGLGHVKDPSSLPLLRGALGSEDAATRLVALSALAEYDQPEVVVDLGTALSDADESVRSAAIALLASRPGPEATRALIAQLASRPIQARLVAALAQPAQGRIEVLARALRSATADTAPLLVSALVRAHRTDASLALEDAFASEDPVLRRVLAPALAVMATGTSRSLLAHAALEDPDEEVREISAAAMVR